MCNITLTTLSLCVQGKVRRMRPSPFNKTSGVAKAKPAAKSRMAPDCGDEDNVCP